LAWVLLDEDDADIVKKKEGNEVGQQSTEFQMKWGISTGMKVQNIFFLLEIQEQVPIINTSFKANLSEIMFKYSLMISHTIKMIIF